jgi:hypothetical protein
MQGEIVPPEQRHSPTSRARPVPRELSAIAMKALARQPQDRYPSVEALRRDIERYLEGRSVSAKPDTYREVVWKMIKRNKALSAAAAVVAVALVWSSVVNYIARREAEQANARVKTRTEQAVPALVESARLGVERRKFKNAHEQVDLALTFAENNADAHLLKGQLLILDLKFGEARAELEQYLKQRPSDGETRRLVELCGRAHPEHISNLLVIAHVFEQQNAPALADGLLSQYGQNSFEARQLLLKLYEQRIAKTWPELKNRLTMDAGGLYHLDLAASKQVVSLTGIEGMPLTSLNLFQCSGVQDLTPLKGMPLASLNLCGCPRITNLSPLRDMPLTNLSLAYCEQVQDLEPLRGMKLNRLDLRNCAVSDLTPLKGMPLTWLMLENCRPIHDLTPLQGMPLTALNVSHCPQVNDLTPLKGMPLTWIGLQGCPHVRDLTPLQEMNLTEIWLTPKNIKVMGALRQMKSLKTVRIGEQEQHRITAEEFWKRYEAGEFK